jgi:hypothetical protein
MESKMSSLGKTGNDGDKTNAFIVYACLTMAAILMFAPMVAQSIAPGQTVHGNVKKVTVQQDGFLDPASTFVKLEGDYKVYRCIFRVDSACAKIMEGDAVTLHLNRFSRDVDSVETD